MDDDELVKGRRHPESYRIGWHLGGPSRTAHINWRGICIGQPGGKGGSLDYIAREGDYSDRDDLQHLAGDPDELREAMAAIEATARIRRGPSAERVAVAGVFELPADSSPAQRKALAEARVAYWRERGHVAVVAVHDEPGNPHVHELVSARPARRGDAGHVVVDRSARIMVGKAALRTERKAVADLVNSRTRPDVRFWGGRDRDMEKPGIVGRRPERRVPRAVRHGQRLDEPEQIPLAHMNHTGARERAKQARQAKMAQKRQKALQRAEKAGVPVHVTKARTDPSPRLIVSTGRLEEMRREDQKTGLEIAQRRLMPAPLPPLTDKQAGWVADTHKRLGMELPADWHMSAEGRAAAFAVVRTVETIRKAGQKPKDSPSPPVSPSPRKPPGRER